MNERDTKFLGFARLLYEDFQQLLREDDSDINEILDDATYPDRWRAKAELLIAQRAYDFAFYLYSLIPYLINTYLDLETLEEVMPHIPDITEWPNTSPESEPPPL